VSCTGPRACYDESKRLGETLCVAFARVRGVPTRMVRPFNNYGPGLAIDDGRVLADFCRYARAQATTPIISLTTRAAAAPTSARRAHNLVLRRRLRSGKALSGCWRTIAMSLR
jgi:nucleoside-diphosphate-sugar epimerase